MLDCACEDFAVQRKQGTRAGTKIGVLNTETFGTPKGRVDPLVHNQATHAEHSRELEETPNVRPLLVIRPREPAKHAVRHALP